MIHRIPGLHTNRARMLRQTMTEAEQRIWQRVRNRKLHGLKFRRQEPIGPFIADFLCFEKHLIVELDGQHHRTEEGLAYDARRDLYLRRLGYQVIRFSNQEVFDNIEKVLEKIGWVCTTNSTST